MVLIKILFHSFYTKFVKESTIDKYLIDYYESRII